MNTSTLPWSHSELPLFAPPLCKFSPVSDRLHSAKTTQVAASAAGSAAQEDANATVGLATVAGGGC